MTFTTLITAAALRPLVGKIDIAIIDCRFDLMNPPAGHRAYLEGHIPGARYADLNRDLSAPVTATSGRHPLPSPGDFAGTLARLRVGPATQVVAYDDSAGAFAARLWWMLRWVGHSAAAVLDGGIKAWIREGGALQAGEEAPSPPVPGHYSSSLQADTAAVITTAALEQRLSDPAFLLSDARAGERFAGTAEPIDAVAGHIRGAVNHAFSANLADDGRFLPAPLLREMWEKRSGVTACHNLLSLEVAGLPGAKLYAGSWSEWIRDPNRPIARGA
jgi:thiosulfate/3-mercaptopyruvate sulfurtransferase